MAIVTLGLTGLFPDGLLPDPYARRAANDRRVPIAVLGDSDSHGYRDTIWMAPHLRGGTYRDRTLQWTEVLERLRANEVDLGAFGTWGGRESVVRVLQWFGVQRRLPRKIDHQHNFAQAGAGSSRLMEGKWRQAPQLRDLMDRDPERWRDGLVIVKIGINNLGHEGMLVRMAKDPADPEVLRETTEAVAHLQAAVRCIREKHPTTRFLLVGILDNVDCPPSFDMFRSKQELENIRTALDRYDAAMRDMAAKDDRIDFFDDRAWFREAWGGRGPDGELAYREVQIAGITVRHEAGDEPTHSVLADLHAGLVWNAKWAQALTRKLAEIGLAITPIRDDEVEHLVTEMLQAGPAPHGK